LLAMCVCARACKLRKNARAPCFLLAVWCVEPSASSSAAPSLSVGSAASGSSSVGPVAASPGPAASASTSASAAASCACRCTALQCCTVAAAALLACDGTPVNGDGGGSGGSGSSTGTTLVAVGSALCVGAVAAGVAVLWRRRVARRRASALTKPSFYGGGGLGPAVDAMLAAGTDVTDLAPGVGQVCVCAHAVAW
jgi:hypothetical protein